MPLIIVNGDTAQLWHQRLLAAYQRPQPLNLRRSAAFGFQAFDKPEQQQRALADDAFGISGERLSKVQAMDVDFLQCSISRGKHLPDSQ
ncbi:hypothetical protein PFUM301598_14000 [Pseudomonas fluorescens]